MDIWQEYDSAAEFCARNGLTGKESTNLLPDSLSAECLAEINDDPDAFQRRVREMAYGIAMEKLNLPDA